MKKTLLTMAAVLGLSVFAAVPAKACTSYYVGSDLTADGSTLYGRTEDIGSAYDKVFQVIQPMDVPADRMWKDESGVTAFTAPYKEGLTKTYRYTACRDNKAEQAGLFGEVGVNEKGVSMSATTTAGNNKAAQAADPFVKNGTGISEENYVDFVLCQAESAKDGVEILGKAITDIGVDYTADGVFIADKNEVWFFEILSGHHYCAVKMPSNKAALIPNCLVLGDVDLDDKDNVISSAGLVDMAKEKEIFVDAQNKDGKNDINLKLTFAGEKYSAGNADRIRAGQYILAGKDNTAIYTDAYQDIFFDIPADKKVTVDKLYQLAGTQFEEFENFSADRKDAEGKAIKSSIRYIGVASSAECHIMQIRKNMPTELATVEWLSLSSAAYAPMVPFYGAALTDVPAAYKEEAPDYTETSAYWVYQSLGKYARENPSAVGVKVKAFYQNYMKKLVADQKTVDKQMMDIATAKGDVSKKATEIGISIGDQTVALAKKLKAEITSDSFVKINTSTDDVQYTLTPKPVTPKPEPPKPVKAPGKAVISKVQPLKGKKIKVTLKKMSGVAGYELAYSTDVNFKKSKTKVKTIKASAKTYTATKLKKGKRYYVKLRAYKKNGTKKVYGSWSAIKIAVVKK